MKKYESPKVIYQETRLNEAIANTCWGYSSNGTGGDLYYDYKGKGWINFTITSNTDCSTSESLTYSIIACPNIPDDKVEEAKAEFNYWWNNTAANGGSPFKGGSIYSEKPPTDWS